MTVSARPRRNSGWMSFRSRHLAKKYVRLDRNGTARRQGLRRSNRPDGRLVEPLVSESNNGAPYGITRPSASPLRGRRRQGLRRSNRPDGRLVEPLVPKSNNGAPYEIRTRVTALRGPCPRPLDEGSGLADLWALGTQEGW